VLRLFSDFFFRPDNLTETMIVIRLETHHEKNVCSWCCFYRDQLLR
jgi:hypothetical protein